MKNQIQIFLPIVLIIIILAGYFIYSNDAMSEDVFVEPKGLKFGTGLNPYPTGVHEEAVLSSVLDNAKDLGVKYLRMEVPNNNQDDPFGLTDPVVSKVLKEKYQIVLSFQPNGDYFSFDDPYQAGYNQAFKIATHYQNVNYFQIGNEPSSGAIKPNWSGATMDSYVKEKVIKVILWLKGASDGVKDANPRSKRIITGHWKHTAFFELLNKNNVGFEIIGWDWFNEESDFFTLTLDDKTTKLIDKLASYDKDLWIMEMGITGKDPAKQAQYLNSFLAKATKEPLIKGLILLTLYDQVHLVGQNGQYDGIISLDKSGDKWELGTPKPAFDIYHKFIKEKR